MKKLIFNISVLALIVGGFTSCDKELDQVPFDEFGTENAYETTRDFENAIRGVYRTLANPSLYGGSDSGGMYDAPDVLSDNVTFAQEGRQTRFTLHNWYYGTANASMSSTYYYSYQMIYRANLLLSHIGDFEGENKQNVEAEARALRALGYLNAVSFFGKIPTQSNDANASLGVPYLDEPDPLARPERQTVGFIYGKIVEDLAAAAEGINTTNPEGRLNKNAVNTLLSRVYLYMGEYAKAVSAANKVTADVAPRESVLGVWQDTNRDGVLFVIPNEESVLGLSVGVTWSQGSARALRPEYVASYELANLYTSDDVRKEAFILETDKYNGIRKLFGRPGQSDGKVDMKIFRAEEAYINKAEALVMDPAGDLNAAKTALKKVMNNRYENPPNIDGLDRNQLRERVRLERRLEFAFESQRFFDLKRWGLGVSRDGQGDLKDGSGTPSESQNLPAGDHRFQLPFSQTAMDRNPNLVQNPGY